MTQQPVAKSTSCHFEFHVNLQSTTNAFPSILSKGEPNVEVPEVPRKERRKRARQFVCDLCGAEMHEESKVRHMAVHHEIYLGKKFTCETCGKVFWTTSQFNAHMRKHNNTDTFIW